MLHCNSAQGPHGWAVVSGFAQGIAPAYVGIDNPYWSRVAQIHTIVMNIS